MDQRAAEPVHRPQTAHISRWSSPCCSPGRLRRPETGLPQLVIMTWVYPGVRSSHDHVRPDPACRNV